MRIEILGHNATNYFDKCVFFLGGGKTASFGDWTVLWQNCFWVFDDSLRFLRDLSVFISFSCIFPCSLSWQRSRIFFMLENHVSLFFTFFCAFQCFFFQFYSESFLVFYFIFCQAPRCFPVLFCRFNTFSVGFEDFYSNTIFLHSFISFLVRSIALMDMELFLFENLFWIFSILSVYFLEDMKF